MTLITYYIYPMPHGPMTIASTSAGLRSIYFGSVHLDGDNTPSQITNQAATQLQEYFAGKRQSFDIPIDIEMSDFQKCVYEELTRIPYGSTITTTQLAEYLGKPGSHRSIGATLKKNPLPIIIPEHRVISGNGVDERSKRNSGLRTLEQRFAQ